MLSANAVVTHGVGKPISMAHTMAQEIESQVGMGGTVAGFSDTVIWSNKDIQGQITGSALYIGRGRGASHGVYIPAVQDKVTCGRITGGAHFAYSDQFGGCDFEIMKDPTNTLVVGHVYSSDECRNAIAARPPGWTHVYTWKSGPYARQWGFYAAIHCLVVVRGTRLRICALRIGGYPTVIQDVRLSAELQVP